MIKTSFFCRLLLIFAFLFSVTACDMIKQKLGMESNTEKEARADADGKAVGGACRQSGRAIEDCYAIYAWLPRASVFQGWREMDNYMRDNQIEVVEPQLPPVAAPPPPPPPPEPKPKKKKAPKTPPPDEESSDQK